MNEQDITLEKDFFNNFTLSRDYDSLSHRAYERLIEHFNNKIDDHNIATALDLGCGSGSFTRRFFNNTSCVIGIDIALNTIKRAIQHQDKFFYINGDLNRLPIKSNSIDLVLFSGSLHHFPILETPLQQAYRVLKPGGILISYDPHINNPIMWLYRHPKSPLYSMKGKTANEILMDKSSTRETLIKAGFTSIETDAISGIEITHLESPFLRPLLPFYNAFENLLGVSPLSKQFGSFLITYAKK